MKAGHTHYTVASGIPELKKAIAKAYQNAHGLEYAPAQVVVSNGAKHSLHNVFTALCNPGDEVIIPAPYWVSYAELVKLTGAKPVIVETPEAGRFQIDAGKTAVRDHAAHDDLAALLAEQSDRQRLYAGGIGRTWPTWCWSAICW